MPRPSWTTFLAGAVVVGAGLIAYHNSLAGPFVLDDAWNIAANPSIRHLWPPWSALAPPPVPGVGGRPLYNFSFALNYAWGGTAVGSYHALNLAIHLLAGLTLFGIVRRTLERKRSMGFQPILKSEHGREAHATFLALAVALLWTVHPLLTESVTYISERSELLMGLFYLLTLYGFIRHADESESGNRKAESGNPKPGPGSKFSLFAFPATGSGPELVEGRFPIFSVAACFCGMASKQSMVTAPLAVLLYDRTFVAGSFRAAWRRRRAYYLALAGTWLLLVWLMIGTSAGQIGFNHGVSAPAYAATECRVVLKYLRLALWPHPLVFDYDLPVVHHLGDAWPAGAALAILLAASAYALLRPARPAGGSLGGRALLRPADRDFGGQAAGFAGAWFFLTLAPTSSFVPVGSQPMAENRMYLPLIAVVALAVLGLSALPRRFRGWVAAALAVVLACLTFQRNAVYASGLALWTDTVEKCPQSARARSNLGAALYRKGRKVEAIGQLKEAVRINPDDGLTRLMLGNVLAEDGHTDEAIIQYREALRIDPDLSPARYRVEALPRTK